MLFCVAALGLAWRWSRVPSFSVARNRVASSEGILFDRNGEILQTYRKSLHVRRLSWISVSQISPELVRAIVASEDRRFDRHWGVDPFAVGRAIWGVLTRSHRGGGSTIAMQTARLLAFDDHRAENKLVQMLDALILRAKWDQDMILEYYLNRVPFRAEIEGIDAASRLLLGRSPAVLTLSESAILAALVRSPQAQEPRVISRACALFDHLLGRGQRLPTECEISGFHFRHEDQSWGPQSAPALVQTAIRTGVQRTTLSKSAQLMTEAALREQLSFLKEKNVSHSAALVVNHHTGEILAYVGSVGQPELPSSAVDVVTSYRQAGSSLKPFLYALALEKRYLTASSLLRDDELEIQAGAGVYRPKNHDRQFHGSVPLRVALASSLNVPAVRTLELVGADEFRNRLVEGGFTQLKEANVYGPSLALGSAEIRLWDLVQASAAMAEGGMGHRLYWSADPNGRNEEQIRISSQGAATIIRDILSDRDARTLGFGSDTVMDLPFPVMVKTGTTHEMRDNWCVASSAQYTVGVWVGNLNGEPMQEVSGLMGAAPAAARILKDLHSQSSTATLEWPSMPLDVVRVGKELYLAGTEPSEIAVHSQNLGSRVAPRFEYPVSGMRVAWDPEIPKKRQLLFPRIRDSGGRPLWWRIQNQKRHIDEGWSPEKTGSYRAELIDVKGTVLDRVQFSVLGRNPGATGVQ